MKNAIEQADRGRRTAVPTSSQVVLTPDRAITHENCHEIEKTFQSAIKKDKTEIIFDCQKIEFMDSAALELLLQIHSELSSRRGALKIIGLNDVCQDIFSATRLNNVLLIYKDIHEATRNI